MILSIAGALLSALLAALFFLLFLGFPLGEYAMGGRQRQLNTTASKLMCLVCGLVQLPGTLAILQAGGILPFPFTPHVARLICYFFGAYLALSALMNLFSKSKKERFAMTPFAFACAACFWFTAQNALV